LYLYTSFKVLSGKFCFVVFCKDKKITRIEIAFIKKRYEHGVEESSS